MSEPAGSPRALDLGLRHLAHERVEEAIAAFSQAVIDDPSEAAAHAFLAAALFADGQPAAADAAIERALALDPDGFWPHLKAGELRFRLGDTEVAATHFLVALRAVEPGTRESAAAADALARARRATTKSIAHRAVLPVRLGRLLGRSAPPAGMSVSDLRGGGP